MGGLIPLLLPSSSSTARSSEMPRPLDSKRPASVMMQHASGSLGHRRQLSLPLAKATKRLTITTPASLPVLPETQEDWRRTINEVKRKYVSRRYRTCSARCCEILDNSEDLSKVDTIHLVYLHFYAASSFEMCARPLSHSSAYRTKLLDDARKHYDEASALIRKAEEAAIHKSRSSSSCSTASIFQSPSISGASSDCTALSSPRNSLSSVEDLRTEGQATRPRRTTKKKVSFSGLPDIAIPKNEGWQSEPYVRPDSPTLGWEEDRFLFGEGDEGSPQVNMAYPSSKPVAAASPKETVSASLREQVPEKSHTETTTSFDLESFLQTRSMNRIISQLSALRSQIAWHRDNIDTLLTEAQDVPETPNVPETPSMPDLTHYSSSSSTTSSNASDVDADEEEVETPASAATTAAMTPNTTLEKALSEQLQDLLGQKSSSSSNLSARLALLNKGSGVAVEAWDRSRSGSVSSTSSSAILPPRAASQMSMRSSSGSGDEALQKRIERLRAGGWQRKRFDNRRYEALREQVLSELS